jgi:carbon storage regulator CsrA
MLVLSRKVDETVIIDGRIVVRVVAIRGGKVRLGFDAPQDVRIVRAELAAGAPQPEQVNLCDRVPVPAAHFARPAEPATDYRRAAAVGQGAQGMGT